MMCYLYKNPTPSSAVWHVLTCQCQGHLHVEIIPDIWCSVDYWWSIRHLFTNFTLTKRWFYCLGLGSHNSTLLCNWWWLNHSTESQTGHPIASLTQVSRNTHSLHQEVCKHVSVKYANMRSLISDFLSLSLTLAIILDFQRVLSFLSKIFQAEMSVVLQRLSERIELSVPGWKQGAHALQHHSLEGANPEILTVGQCMLKPLWVIHSSFFQPVIHQVAWPLILLCKNFPLDILQCAPHSTTDQIAYSWSFYFVIPEFLKTKFW